MDTIFLKYDVDLYLALCILIKNGLGSNIQINCFIFRFDISLRLKSYDLYLIRYGTCNSTSYSISLLMHHFYANNKSVLVVI